jgi:hypothetical protein
MAREGHPAARVGRGLQDDPPGRQAASVLSPSDRAELVQWVRRHQRRGAWAPGVYEEAYERLAAIESRREVPRILARPDAPAGHVATKHQYLVTRACLDRVSATGVLPAHEHARRRRAAEQATTTSELRFLIEDLPGDTSIPPGPRRTTARALRLTGRLALTVGCAVGIALGWVASGPGVGAIVKAVGSVGSYEAAVFVAFAMLTRRIPTGPPTNLFYRPPGVLARAVVAALCSGIGAAGGILYLVLSQR